MGERDGSAGDLAEFLRLLGSDAGAAGVRYERLRGRLLVFFSARDLPMADMLADLAIDRLARRMVEGLEVTSVEAYLLGIARHIAQEEGRRERKRVWLEERELGNISRAEDTAVESGRGEHEARMVAVERCFERLALEDGRLLRMYYMGDRGERIRNRLALAGRLGLSSNALRKRAFRLRAVVERCAVERLSPWNKLDELDDLSGRKGSRWGR